MLGDKTYPMTKMTLDETVSRAPIEQKNGTTKDTDPAIAQNNDASIQKPACLTDASEFSVENYVSQ